VRPAARREAVGHLRTIYRMSERRACRVIGAHRRTMRYRRRTRDDEPQVRERLRTLAAEHPRWGYRRLHLLLQREGMTINRKRVYRLYRLDGLAVRRRRRKRAARIPRGIVSQPWRRGEAWAMDFMQDTLANGRQFRTLNILDTPTATLRGVHVLRFPARRASIASGLPHATTGTACTRFPTCHTPPASPAMSSRSA